MSAPDAAAATGPIRTDALVVGAGPVGLFAVFELGLLELSAQVVDALPHPGGQCAELYPDKPIYDIPGLPHVGGQELVQRLLQQAAPFQPGLHLGQLVSHLAPRADGRFDVHTDGGLRFDAGVVLIAAGAGAFLPRLLDLPGLAPLEGLQVHHRRPTVEARAAWRRGFDGQRVLVLGDQDAALDEAAALAESGHCARVTLMHRRRQFRAEPALVARVDAAEAAGRLQVVAAQPIGTQLGADGRLQALRVVDSEGAEQALPADQLLPLLGISPKLGPVAGWGLALERRQLTVDTAAYQTSQPGIFAVGDINTYPGKRKLLLCGFHEATLAAFAAADRLRPGRSQALQYTTTSPRLHALLGVAPGTASR